MAPIAESPSARTSELGFSISHQKVELDIDLPNQSLKGRIEITINPHSRDLKVIRLNSRQSTFSRLTVNGKAPSGVTWANPYKRASLPWKAGVHQYHMLQQKLEEQLKDPPEEELVIPLPKNFRIDELDPFSEEAQNILLSKSLGGSKRESLDGSSSAVDLAQSSRTAVEQTTHFTPITIIIEYVVNHIRDGMQFVGWEEGDLRYPHAFSTNSHSPGAACCLFPCTDALGARCTWEISIKCQKSIGDALRSSSAQLQMNGTNGLSNGVNGHNGVPSIDEKANSFSDEDKALDLAVVCTGDMTDEVREKVWLNPTLADISRLLILETLQRKPRPSYAPRPYRHSTLDLLLGPLSTWIWQNSVRAMKMKGLDRTRYLSMAFVCLGELTRSRTHVCQWQR